MNSLQGHLLVASPHLPDPNFYHSVVLIVQHGDDGALGLVLNRPSDSTVKELFDSIGEFCSADCCVGVGGPIRGPLMALHAIESCSESEVIPGVYFAAERQHLLEIAQADDSSFRVFSGYAGWGAGQLESEMAIGGWLTLPATIDYIFGTPTDAMWKRATMDIGDDILRAGLRVKHVPPDPSVN